MRGNKDITDSYLIYPWLTRHMVNGCIRRMKSKSPKSTDIVALNTNDVAISNVTILVDSSIKKGGRPKGSTAASKVDIQNKIELAKDRISIIYKYRKDDNNGLLKNGDYKKIHDSVLKDLGIDDQDIAINPRCIQQRVLRNSLTVDNSCNQQSPLLSIEPILLRISLWKQDAGQPIIITEGL